MDSNPVDVRKCLAALPEAARAELFAFIQASAGPPRQQPTDEAAYLQALITCRGQTEAERPA